jgi:hypothetical protein
VNELEDKKIRRAERLKGKTVKWGNGETEKQASGEAEKGTKNKDKAHGA